MCTQNICYYAQEMIIVVDVLDIIDIIQDFTYCSKFFMLLRTQKPFCH